MRKVKAYLRLAVLKPAIWIAERAWDMGNTEDLAWYKTLIYMRDEQLYFLGKIQRHPGALD